MKRLLIAALLGLSCAPALAQVAASITVGQPGFYGRIDIGAIPEPPQLIFAEPIIVEHVVHPAGPIYLRVPPGHAKHWAKHCAEYRACGRPVYFVRDDWYDGVYVPRYRETHGHDDGDDQEHEHGHGDGEGHGRGRGRGHNDKDDD